MRRVPAEQAWELEATLVMVEHVSGGSMPAESVEWLLAEGLATLVNEAPPEVSDISERLARRAEEARAHLRELAAERDDHIDGIHTGRIRVTGRAPDELTWYIGREPILVVRGREKELRDR